MQDIAWAPGVTYGDVWQPERAGVLDATTSRKPTSAHAARHFEEWEAECRALLEAGLPLPAYDGVLKCSHVFNLLDARGAISVTERVAYIARVRKLARAVAQALRRAARAGDADAEAASRCAEGRAARSSSSAARSCRLACDRRAWRRPAASSSELAASAGWRRSAVTRLRLAAPHRGAGAPTCRRAAAERVEHVGRRGRRAPRGRA